MDEVMVRCSLRGLVAVLLTAATCLPASVPAGGWFDLPKPSENSRVLAAAASNAKVIFALSEGQNGRVGARLFLYDSNLNRQTSWWVAGDVSRVAITSDSVAGAIRRSVRTNDSVDETYQVCLYAFDGSPKGGCIGMENPPEALVGVGERLLEVSSHRVNELDFQRQLAIPRNSIALLDDGAVLASAAGDHLVRVGSETMNGAALHLSAGTEKALSFMSSQLAAHSSMQPHASTVQYPGARQQIAWHIVGLDDGGLLVFPGRGNFFQGFQVDRFDSRGTYTDTIVLQALSFPEFTRMAVGPASIGNLRGFLRPSLVIRSADRVILVDQLEGRCAWYVIPSGVRQ
jgi:hypothetical protein